MIKERHKYVDNPYGFVLPKPKPVIHPLINHFNDFLEEDKIILNNIVSIVTSKLGEANIYIFGSRTKGNWDENSDYDILVEKDVDKQTRDFLKLYNFGVKVDINFSSKKIVNFDRFIKIN